MQPPYYEGWTQGPSPASAAPHQTGAGNGMQPPALGLRAGGAEAYEASCPAVRPEPPPAPPPGPRKDEEAFARMYVLQEEIGRGAFSVVHRCTNRVTGEDFAVKIIDLRPLQLRESFDQTRLRREVEIMRKLHHPNVIRLEEVFETPKTMMLVLEYARGTELFDSILQKKKYPEDEARPIFEQLANALGYLHSLNIVHRDIKPENVVLLDKPSPEGYMPFAKLLDFGLSKMIGQDDGSAARTFVGTPCYLAPEVEARAYGQGKAYGTKVDCWSLGAVLYVMLVARFPEFDRSNGGMRVKLDSALWATVSDSAKDLIRCLMTADPDARYSVRQALSHPWVTGMPFLRPAPPLMAGFDRMAIQQQQPQGAGRSTVPSSRSSSASQADDMMDMGGGQQQQQPVGETGASGRWAQPAGTPGPGVEVFKLTSTGDQVGGTPAPPSSITPPHHQYYSHHHPDSTAGCGSWLGDAAAAPSAAKRTLIADDRSSSISTVGPGSPLVSCSSSSASSTASSYTVRTHYTVGPHTKVIRGGAAEEDSEEAPQDQTLQAFSGEHLNLLPLVNIQHSIAQSIELAHRACLHRPEDADDIKRSAILCRSQLIYTIKLLKKIEQTATSVLDMFPDLELAVEDGEPTLAHGFFNTVKTWVGDLRRTVSEAQHRNHESMIKLHKILVRGDSPRHATSAGVANQQQQQPAPRESWAERGPGSEPPSPLRQEEAAADDMSTSGAAGRGRTSSVDMDTGATPPRASAPTAHQQQGSGATSSTSTQHRNRVRARDEISRPHSEGGSSASSAGSSQHQSPAYEGGLPSLHQAEGGGGEGLMSLDGDLYQVVKKLKEAKEKDEPISENQLLDLFLPINSSNTAGQAAAAAVGPTLGAHPGHHHGHHPAPFAHAGRPLEHSSSGSSSASSEQSVNGSMGLMRMTDSLDQGLDPIQEEEGGAKTPQQQQQQQQEGMLEEATKSQELSMVLGKLKDVDHILEHLAIFWAQTEVILDVLLQKSDHVERFVEFAHKPRLLTRFRQRMGEYKHFWKDVQTMCRHFTSSVNQAAPTCPMATPGVQYYRFLEQGQDRR